MRQRMRTWHEFRVLFPLPCRGAESLLVHAGEGFWTLSWDFPATLRGLKSHEGIFKQIVHWALLKQM